MIDPDHVPHTRRPREKLTNGELSRMMDILRSDIEENQVYLRRDPTNKHVTKALWAHEKLLAFLGSTLHEGTPEDANQETAIPDRKARPFVLIGGRAERPINACPAEDVIRRAEKLRLFLDCSGRNVESSLPGMQPQIISTGHCSIEEALMFLPPELANLVRIPVELSF